MRAGANSGVFNTSRISVVKLWITNFDVAAFIKSL